MDMKSNGTYRNHMITCLFALSGLIFGAILSFYFNNGFGEITSTARIGTYLAELTGAGLRKVDSGILTLEMKFLHFLVSKWLQYRYISPYDHSKSFLKSCLFWVALTRSVSSTSIPEQLLT